MSKQFRPGRAEVDAYYTRKPENSHGRMQSRAEKPAENASGRRFSGRSVHAVFRYCFLKSLSKIKNKLFLAFMAIILLEEDEMGQRSKSHTRFCAKRGFQPIILCKK
jgi:hypothetical protein